jgi:hypothetical protein
VSEINPDILEAIKIAFKGKSVVITVEEENEETASYIPSWQKELVQKRQQYYLENPQELKSWEEIQKTIKTD